MCFINNKKNVILMCFINNKIYLNVKNIFYMFLLASLLPLGFVLICGSHSKCIEDSLYLSKCVSLMQLNA
jgi:hypothetical protein